MIEDEMKDDGMDLCSNEKIQDVDLAANKVDHSLDRVLNDSVASSSIMSEQYDEERGMKLTLTKNLVPTFRCVIFSLGKYKTKSDGSDRSVETDPEESPGQSALGLDLLVQEHAPDEENSDEVWVIDHVSLTSPLFDSPLEQGDVLVTVNGKTNVQQGLDEALSDHNEIITIVVHNPRPEAQADLVETWIHPSAYSKGGENCIEKTISTLKTEEVITDFMGLRLKPTEDQEFLEVDSVVSGDSASKLWKHAMLDSRDVLLSVDRLSVATTSTYDIRRALKHDKHNHRPVTIRTRLQSTAGLAIAHSMRQKSKSFLALTQQSNTSIRVRFAIFVGVVAVGVFIAFLIFTLRASRHKDDEAKSTYSSSGEVCTGDGCLTVDGRPFRDVRGIDIVAGTQECSASSVSLHDSLWSKMAAESHDSGTNDVVAVSSRLEERVSGQKIEWLNRGVAEHASIASFAAFTISLMTNKAPPDLVHDALQAAMDEWHHATISFYWANHFQDPDTSSHERMLHEPSALPPTQHSFENNLHALAKATVLEGCIGETLSALDLAYQVDQQLSESGDVVPAMAAATQKIALEEARHAALAWRTVRWVCRTDSSACEIVQQEVLNAATMKEMFEKRFPAASAELEQAWKNMYTNLLPFAQGSSSTYNCSRSDPNNGTVSNVASRILESCWCPDSQTAASARL